MPNPFSFSKGSTIGGETAAEEPTGSSNKLTKQRLYVSLKGSTSRGETAAEGSKGSSNKLTKPRT